MATSSLSKEMKSAGAIGTALRTEAVVCCFIPADSQPTKNFKLILADSGLGPYRHVDFLGEILEYLQIFLPLNVTVSSVYRLWVRPRDTSEKSYNSDS